MKSHIVLASALVATLIGWGQGGNAANTPAPVITQVEIFEQAALNELRSSFLDVSGGDRVAFAKGSFELTPKTRFRLERQALWLRENEFVAVGFRSESTSAKGVEERRLALRRAEAVQGYLNEFGIAPDRFVGVDVEFGLSGTVTTLIHPFHFGEPAARQASGELVQPPR